MEKIYGFKEKDLIDLAKFIKDKNTVKNELFKEYALITNKAQGTVRNLYYALVKVSNKDKDFCKKYLNGKPIKINRGESFSDLEERDLLKKILLSVNDGNSVRSAILELANYNSKLALRYQNKYRSILKKGGKTLEEVIDEIKKEKGGFSFRKKMAKERLNDFQIKKVGDEINCLVDRIIFSVKKENEFLKNKIYELECENSRLNNLISGSSGVSAIDYFSYPNKRIGEN